ncbi:MAG: hypothetical protein ACYTEL_18760 [Planctomycetota bacterium]|jgi:hypothetical protein
MKLRKWLVPVAAILVLLTAAVLWLYSGYYGQFMRVRWRLKQVPGIRIISFRQHRDIALEDFWFTVQTRSNLKIVLQFSHVDKTYELFKSADGLCVQQPGSAYYLLYRFGPGGRLDQATGKQIRNAGDVLQNIDKIAEIIEADRRQDLAKARWQDVPKGYLWIQYPVP